MKIDEHLFDELCLDLIKSVDYDTYKEVSEEFAEEGQTREMVEMEIVLNHYGIYRYVNYN